MRKSTLIYKISPNLKKVLVFVLAVSTLLVVGLEVVSRLSVTVVIDEQGFHPATVNIQPGQKIIWRNMGAKLHWPASNNHPTHTEYLTTQKGCMGSALDACRGLSTGETFAFTFYKPGSWGVHDHVMPGNVMSVNVADVRSGWIGKLQLLWKQIFSKSNKLSQFPTPEKYRELPYSEQLSVLQSYANQDPEAAWKYLKDAFIVNGQVIHQIHEFGHIVGNRAYKKLGMAGVKICDESFAYSCFHGVAEDAIRSEGEEAIKNVEQACIDNLGIPQQPNCFHGIGHGVAGMFDIDMKKSLAACDLMKTPHRNYCYDGVMMEQVGSVQTQGSVEKPWDLCGSLDAVYHIACGRYQPTRLSALGWDYTKIINYCGDGPTEILKEHCFRSSGFMAATLSNNDANELIALCEATPETLGRNWCLIAAATEVTFQRYTDADQVSMTICASIEDYTMKLECTDSVQSLKKRESSGTPQ